MKILSLQHSFCLICIFSKSTTVQFACSQVVVYLHHSNPSQKFHHHLTWSPIWDAFFVGQKDIGFCPSFPADALMNLFGKCAMRRGVVVGWTFGVRSWSCKWWKSQGPQGPLKMSEKKWKVAKKRWFVQQKMMDLLGGRDLVVVLMCMFRVEL